MERWKKPLLFLKVLELEQIHLKNGELAPILGRVS